MRAAALAFLLAASARAEAPFQELSFAEATARARERGKFLFVDLVTDGCGPCEIMRLTAYKDPAVLAWLDENAVAIEPNAARLPGIKDALRARVFPTLILFDSKGRELDRATGGHDGPRLLAFLKDASVGKTTIERLRREIAQSTSPIAALETRFVLANALDVERRDKEALAEYLWLYDHGPKTNPEFRYMTQGTLLHRLIELGKRHPPAMKALESRRQAAWKELAQVPSSTWTARAVVMIDSARKQPGRTIKAFQSLPPDDPRRPVLGKFLRAELPEAERAALDLPSPDRIQVLAEAPPPPLPFRELTLDAAKAAAKKAGKLLFLNTVTDRCPPCERMHRTTFKDPAFLAWIERHALAVEIHAARNMKDIRRMRVSNFPTIVLYDRRGRELTRLDGHHETTALLRALDEGVAGRSRLDAARAEAEKAAGGEARAKARYEHALQLIGAGKDAEATELVVALYAREMKPYPKLHGFRNFLLMNFVTVADRHPPAAAELRRLRAEAAARLEKAPTKEDASDLVWYDRALRREDDALALYDSWPEGDPRRKVLGPHVINSLRGNKRWAEALELEGIKDPVADLREQLRAAESDRVRENIVRMSAIRVLGLAQGKKDAEAKRLIAAMFEADSSTTTRADLKETLDLLGRADLLPPAR